MIRLLVDTNVMFDYFAQRHPFDKEARLLLFGCAAEDYELWMSSSQITDLFFLLTHGNQKISQENAVDTMSHLRKHMRIAALSESDVDNALASDWKDFEDACVYFVARRTKATYIITRNKKDFERSELPVLTPSEFLSKFESDFGISYAEIDL